MIKFHHLCSYQTVAQPFFSLFFLRWRSFWGHRPSTMRRRRRGSTTGGRGWGSSRMFLQPVLEPWSCIVCIWVSRTVCVCLKRAKSLKHTHWQSCRGSDMLLFLCVSVCVCATGLLQMQMILHYDVTYREVKYSNLGLEDIDRKMMMGINVTPIISLLYTPVLIR